MLLARFFRQSSGPESLGSDRGFLSRNDRISEIECAARRTKVGNKNGIWQRGILLTRAGGFDAALDEVRGYLSELRWDLLKRELRVLFEDFAFWLELLVVMFVYVGMCMLFEKGSDGISLGTWYLCMKVDDFVEVWNTWFYWVFNSQLQT